MIPAVEAMAKGFSTLCGFLAVRRTQRTEHRVAKRMFQYPLRVLGCEKQMQRLWLARASAFQYPLRVLGCE